MHLWKTFQILGNSKMIEMIPIKIDHEVVGVGGSIPLDDLFVEKEAGGTLCPPPWSKWPLWPQGFNTPSRFVCHRRRHKKRKIKFMFVYWAWIILLGCFLYFLLIAIWFTSYYGGKGWSKIYLVTKIIFLVMKSSSLWRL